jgi:hypothetical protein
MERDVIAMLEATGGNVAYEDGARLMDQARQGDVTALPALRVWLDSYAGDQAVQVADLARIVQADLIKLVVGAEDLALGEAFARCQAALVQELAGPTPSPLEQHCAQRVAFCQLYLSYVEYGYLQILPTLTLAQCHVYERRINHAQRRYLQAMRTLAQVRTLRLPAVQINVGQQQVNVVDGR